MMNELHQQYNLAIKSISAIIPGYGDAGTPYGSLICTEKLLQNMSRSESTQAKEFDNEFIKNKLGINSIAMSNCTLEFCHDLWANSSNYTQALAFAASQSRLNSTLYKMLHHSVIDCIGKLKNSSSYLPKIKAHIHIAGITHPYIEPELHKIRQTAEISLNEPLTTIILQQGCAGLFVALKLSQRLLRTFADPSEVILITAENNMMIDGHRRLPGAANTSNMNDWLWPAIFGEGVGAMIVGNYDATNMNGKSLQKNPVINWKIDKLATEVVANDWRVNYQWHQEQNYAKTVIRAREVTKTYMKGVTKHAKTAIESYNGLDTIFRVCLHESNPNLLKFVANELNIPQAIIPTVSSITGTLACVSAFSILQIADSDFRNYRNSESNVEKNKIIMSLIGEAGGRVDAGHLCLSAGG